jgi:hypothetical protein
VLRKYVKHHGLYAAKNQEEKLVNCSTKCHNKSLNKVRISGTVVSEKQKQEERV